MIKEKLLEIIKEKSPIKKEKITKILDIKKHEKSDFLKLVKELEEDGEIILCDNDKYIVVDGDRYRKGVLQGNERGFAFLLQEEDDIFISEDNLRGALNKDEVIVELSKDDRGKKLSGKVVKILKRANSKIVGTLQNKTKFGFVVPDDNKFGYDIFISKKDLQGAKDGQKVVVTLTSYPEKDKKPEGKIIEILGYPGDKQVDIMSIVAGMDITINFPKKVLEFAKKVPQEVSEDEIEKRKDFRDITTFTIDGKDAKDFDDAVSIKELENGNYELGVHIADVSHYVREKDLLDEEAYRRGNSIYLVDKVIPMLPVELSNGICSLNEGVDRLTLSVIMEIDTNGKVLNHSIHKGVIKSSKRLVYDNVSDFLEKGIVHESIVGLEDDLKAMEKVASFLRQKRINRGSIDFDFEEAKIMVNEEGHAIDVVKEERRVSNKLIEEFMLVCNETVAEEFFWLEVPFLYRVHEEPDEEKIQSLNKILRQFNLKLNTQNLDSKDVENLLLKVKGKEEELFVNTVVLRSLKKARYSENSEIHFGLASKYYTHFTSPIRRYSDLFIHRIIKKVIENELNENQINHYDKIAPDVAKQTSKQERLAQDAERMIEDIKFAEYMGDHIGEEYKAIITSITGFGIFAGLENTIEGLISYSNMKEYFEYDENKMIAVSRESSKVYHVGDKVIIKVISTNTTKGTIDFEIVGDDIG